MSASNDRYENAVARYFEAWNAGEPDALTKAVAAAWAAEEATPIRWPRCGDTDR